MLSFLYRVLALEIHSVIWNSIDMARFYWRFQMKSIMNVQILIFPAFLLLQYIKS